MNKGQVMSQKVAYTQSYIIQTQFDHSTKDVNSPLDPQVDVIIDDYL